MHKSPETPEVAPTIIALQERLEALRQNELERISRHKVNFGPEQLAAIEELTRGIIAGILYGPVNALKDRYDDREPAALLSVVHRIFNLDGKFTGRASICAPTSSCCD